MTEPVRIAFERRVLTLPFDQILPTRTVAKEIRAGSRYRRIKASIAEVGIIEPMLIARLPGRSDRFLLVDGYLRLDVLKAQGDTSGPFLIADDDEAYTCNKRVNKLATIQEHFMLLRAIERGVPAEKLARALNLQPRELERKRTMLDGICQDVVDMLKDKVVNQDVFAALRKMKPVRQIEATNFMLISNNLTAGYARALVVSPGRAPGQPEEGQGESRGDARTARPPGARDGGAAAGHQADRGQLRRRRPQPDRGPRLRRQADRQPRNRPLPRPPLSRVPGGIPQHRHGDRPGAERRSKPMNAMSDPAILAIRWRIAEVTPEDAERWLLTMEHPRLVRHTLMSSFIRDMATGHWHLNGAPLIFDRQDRLLDGQMRLKACIAAGRPFPSLIVGNVDPERQFTIDGMHGRGIGIILKLRDPRDGDRALGSTLSLIWAYYFNPTGDVRTKHSIPELLHILERRPELRREVAAVAEICPDVLPPPVAAALLHLGSRVGAEDLTRTFLAELASSDPPSETARSLRLALAGLPARYHRNRTGILRLAIRALNAARAGRSLTHLTWRDRIGATVDGLANDDGADLIGATSIATAAAGQAGDLRVSLEIITPEVAARLLANNPRNRPQCRPTVERYRREMAEGRWVLNGQTVKLSRDGRLIDGQHRCRAAVEAGCPFPTLVVANVDEAAFDTLDIGRRRGFDEILAGRGDRNISALAAATRLLWTLRHPQRRQPSAGELLAFLEANPDVRLHARPRAPAFKGLWNSSVSALHFLFAHEDAAKAETFFARLLDGANLDRTSPILVLRNTLLDLRLSPDPVSERRKIAMTIKAWRAFRAGKPLRALSFNDRGPRAEPFPELTWPAGMPEPDR